MPGREFSYLVPKTDQHLTMCICECMFRLSCNRVLSGGVSWILSMAPNIHRNVDGEVAYAVSHITVALLVVVAMVNGRRIKVVMTIGS